MQQPWEIGEGYLNMNARASRMSQFSSCCILEHDPGGEFEWRFYGEIPHTGESSENESAQASLRTP
jgi:hypothetical protein